MLGLAYDPAEYSMSILFGVWERGAGYTKMNAPCFLQGTAMLNQINMSPN